GFDWVKVGDGRAFMTGYYEPEIEGSRTPQPGYVPIYRVPPDLVRCTKTDGTTGRGRIDETGTCVLYYTRAEIEDGALAGKGRELMRENLSYVFFKELTGPGPLGALNVPVTPRQTVAADPNYVPLGAPIYVSRADRPEVNRLWVAQDTGGAIKGPNRFDTFWGA